MKKVRAKPIPVVILTRNEPEFLDLTVKSILKRTIYPFEMFIVDNHSTHQGQILLLAKLASNPLITVIYNSSNEWLLGFNAALEIVKRNSSLDNEYIVLSDGDITVPLAKDNTCWLGYMAEQMRKNACVGKIGLSLDLGYIKTRKLFKKTYNKELAFNDGLKIGDLTIAPVDTTTAMYRKDIYVLNDFKIMPGHASLVRPYYYVTRTSSKYQAKHLGWRSYVKPSAEQAKQKIQCFTKYGAQVDPILLEKVDVATRIWHKIAKHIFRGYWGIFLVYNWLKYIVKHFPRRLNRIQSGQR